MGGAAPSGAQGGRIPSKTDRICLEWAVGAKESPVVPSPGCVKAGSYESARSYEVSLRMILSGAVWNLGKKVW
jgi:hypothetical protein